MKKLLLYLCKKTFAIGFLVAGLALANQAIEIIRSENAQGISLITFIIFTLLHINGILYSYFIAKDKILLVGTLLNALACLAISILKLIYGWVVKSSAYCSPFFYIYKEYYISKKSPKDFYIWILSPRRLGVSFLLPGQKRNQKTPRRLYSFYWY